MDNNEDKFKYRDLDGLINIITLSPSFEFYYQVQKPVSINMSNFACLIAFYNMNGNLIYHRSSVMAHWLEPWNTIEVVRWSKEGDMAYMYEYNRNEVYESVFLNLSQQVCYRINELEDNFNLVNSLNIRNMSYDETSIIKKLQNLGYQSQPLIVDDLPKSSLNKWHPRLQ